MSKTITVDGVQYVPITPTGPWRVWIIADGWVILGKRPHVEAPAGEVMISNALNVRKYGDGAGVAGFTVNREALELDKFPTGDVSLPQFKVIFSFALPSSWEPPGV